MNTRILKNIFPTLFEENYFIESGVKNIFVWNLISRLRNLFLFSTINLRLVTFLFLFLSFCFFLMAQKFKLIMFRCVEDIKSSFFCVYGYGSLNKMQLKKINLKNAAIFNSPKASALYYRFSLFREENPWRLFLWRYCFSLVNSFVTFLGYYVKKNMFYSY